ncbi:hypothetical protein LguiB_020425 [Lonicera macranthoides]
MAELDCHITEKIFDTTVITTHVTTIQSDRGKALAIYHRMILAALSIYMTSVIGNSNLSQSHSVHGNNNVTGSSDLSQLRSFHRNNSNMAAIAKSSHRT